jgi:NAD(P)-dependent dehydrogenase (short-subunit alcohol dehydrogenase family)
MTVRRRPLDGTVVVVTGASSGIGYATAVAFARHRCRLVLVGRDVDRLREVLAACDAAGGIAITVAADVADAGDVEHIVETAVAEFGRIDTWVNGAAVLVAAVLGTESVAELERLVDTNVLGTLLGSRAALQRFREQGTGTLINVSSLLGILPNPVVPAYVMSKFATRGLTLSLHEAARAWPGVEVCVVEPGPVDTPMFERAANHTGRRLRAIPPACSAERAAATIVACARRPRRRVVVGWTGKVISVVHHVAPATTERVAAAAVARLIVQREPVEPTSGASTHWHGPASTDGGWRRWRARRAIGDSVGRLRSRR